MIKLTDKDIPRNIIASIFYQQAGKLLPKIPQQEQIFSKNLSTVEVPFEKDKLSQRFHFLISQSQFFPVVFMANCSKRFWLKTITPDILTLK